MVRHPQPLPSSTKRNRITFKTRLKLTFGDHCTDNGLVDEEEEKNRFLQRVAGVDQEDANVSRALQPIGMRRLIFEGVAV